MRRDLYNAGEQVRNNVADMAEKARGISRKMKDQWSDTYRDLEQGVHRAQEAGVRGVDEARERIKENPVTSVATVGIAAFALGLFAGLMLGKKSRDSWQVHPDS
jgi:ElaB/YqjD/DUF883 family membrane-anchored ribosome-binding protein